MRIAWILLAAPLIAAPAAFAADKVCAQNYRIVSSRVIDSSQVSILVRDGQRFTVHMRGHCVALDRFSMSLSFRSRNQLGCLSKGDTISYNRPGEDTQIFDRRAIQTPCYIDSVTADTPKEGS